MKNATLELLFPHGLVFLPAETPVLPSLKWLVARGDLEQGQALELDEYVFQKLGLKCEQDIPVAAFEGLSVDGDMAGQYWYIKAKLISLVPDRAHLVFGNEDQVSHDATLERQLLKDINDFFRDSDLLFKAAGPGHWLIRSQSPFSLSTSSFVKAIQHKIVVSLFEGGDASAWMNWNNEIQMWLHDYPGNRARQQKGLPVFNSLWLWGSGCLPQNKPESPWDLVVGDSLLLKGLARWLGVENVSYEAFFRDPASYVRRAKRILCVPGPEIGPIDTRRVDGEWLSGALSLLKQGKIGHLQVMFPNGTRIAASPTSRWRFWRKAPALENILANPL